jgi:hypothetical protein
MSHTRGPWEAIGAAVRTFEGHRFVADVRSLINKTADQEQADACLIAAAPDLLDAIKRVLAGFEANAFQRNTDGDGDPAWAIKFMPHLLALSAAVKAIDKAEGK